MKRFEFPLERVREWREKQVAVEEAKLERLFGELSAISAARAELDAEQARNEQMVVQSAGVTASDLRALDGFRRYVKAERVRIENLRADCNKRIDEQRAAILEARRRYELLARLKQRNLRIWTAEMNRELEANAAEAYLARWSSQPSAGQDAAPSAMNDGKSGRRRVALPGCFWRAFSDQPSGNTPPTCPSRNPPDRA